MSIQDLITRELMTVDDAARELNTGYWPIRYMLEKRDLERVKLPNNGVLITRNSVDALKRRRDAQ